MFRTLDGQSFHGPKGVETKWLWKVWSKYLMENSWNHATRKWIKWTWWNSSFFHEITFEAFLWDVQLFRMILRGIWAVCIAYAYLSKKPADEHSPQRVLFAGLRRQALVRLQCPYHVYMELLVMLPQLQNRPLITYYTWISQSSNVSSHLLPYTCCNHSFDIVFKKTLKTTKEYKIR